MTIIDCNHELLLSNWPMFEQNQYSRAAFFPCQEEGGIGEYNRANRSLGQFVENVAGGVGAPLATLGDDEVTRELGELGRWTMFEGFDMVNHGEWWVRGENCSHEWKD